MNYTRDQIVVMPNEPAFYAREAKLCEDWLEMDARIQMLEQTSAELCLVCGWRTLFPSEGCCNCRVRELEAERDAAQAELQKTHEALRKSYKHISGNRLWYICSVCGWFWLVEHTGDEQHAPGCCLAVKEEENARVCYLCGETTDGAYIDPRNGKPVCCRCEPLDIGIITDFLGEDDGAGRAAKEGA